MGNHIDKTVQTSRAPKVPGFSLRQALYFVTAAESGTLSEAALRLHVSQSGLSLAINELERALKVQLCIRRKAHGITLTSAGKEALHQMRALLRQVEELESAVSGSGDHLSGRLSVGCYVTLAPTVLPPLLQGFSELHPMLTVDFTEGTQDALQRKLLDGELDLAVLYDMDVLPEMERVALFSMRPHVLLPADHRLAGEPKVALRDLVAEPMVLLDAPPSSLHTLLLCKTAGVTPLVRHRTTNFEMARALVGRGLGYAILIQRPPNDRTYEGLRVVHKEIAELPEAAVSVLLCWPQQVAQTRRAAEFVRYCLEDRRGT
ncbi:LysR substrate-binding domain-containing protein [Wenjunlia tyrosinilytica]|uniref:Transcriptional regulator n=1 Tax=Wenjunlia tyrosinilytica TaxID=1544741 RepID=A0A917ZE52_9ACTN|nr:LysR substrate-binding domain-containing protein [Wenjunlia tyrosinilytica]GGO80177.1 transcriptional regulator [Wenjunlia tyrosinilytica]